MEIKGDSVSLSAERVPEESAKIEEIRKKIQARTEKIREEQEKNCPGFKDLNESLQKILTLGSLSNEELKAKIFLNREERSKKRETLSSKEKNKINNEIATARVFLMFESRGRISTSRKEDEKKRLADDARIVNEYLKYLESKRVHNFSSGTEGGIANSAESLLKIHYNTVRTLCKDNKAMEKLTHKPIDKEEILKISEI